MADREINKIVYGGRTFYQDSIKNGNMYLAASLLSEQLEVNTLEFDLVSDDTSLTNFIRNDKLAYFYGGNQTAIFYLQNVERTGPRMYHFTSNSAIGLLMEGLHYGGIYTGQTVEEVLPGIMGSVPYYIKSNLKPIKLYGWLPVAAPRDNLSQVLFAIGATVKTDLDGYLRIESFWDSVSSITGKDRIYSGAKVGYTPAVTQVVVTEHQYVESAESMQLFEGTTAAGDIVTFNEPMHGLSASGFTIVDSGANWARLSAGSGTLTGLKYTHNTRQITKDVAEAQVPNIKKVENATLISLVNSQATAERLVNFYKWLETVDAAVVYKGEKPGDRVQVWHPYDNTDTTACLQSADVTLSNVLKAQEKALVGYVPPAVGDIVTYDNRTVLTGSGRWTVPEGVKNLRVVLIGGGDGGQGGYNGQNGEDSESSTANGHGGSAYSPGGSGGAGGDRGLGGSGGKVFIADIVIPEGVTSLQFSCGAGGKAGESDGGSGQPGGASTLTAGNDVYSSDDGSASAVGYTDTQTEEVFAIQGVSGQAGANGGNGGTHTTTTKPGDESRGEDGQDAGPNPGGAGGAADYHSFGTVGTSYYIKYGNETLDTSSDGVGTNGHELRGWPNYSFDSTTGMFTTGGIKTMGTTGKPPDGGGSETIYYANPKYPNKSSYIYRCRYTYKSEISWRDYSQDLSAAASSTAYAYSHVRAGGGGGGAAYNNPGGAAPEGFDNIAGGKGANGTAPSDATVYGNGGDGGNGGGGGGGGGGTLAATHQNATWPTTADGVPGGAGGTGSPGSAGGPGCIILYYGIPHVTSSGWLKTSDGKFFNGRLMRRFIV